MESGGHHVDSCFGFWAALRIECLNVAECFFRQWSILNSSRSTPSSKMQETMTHTLQLADDGDCVQRTVDTFLCFKRSYVLTKAPRIIQGKDVTKNPTQCDNELVHCCYFTVNLKCYKTPSTVGPQQRALSLVLHGFSNAKKPGIYSFVLQAQTELDPHGILKQS